MLPASLEGHFFMMATRGDSECMVRVGPLMNLADLVHSLDVAPEPVFRTAGFEVGEFEDPDHRIPYLRCSALLAQCVTATGCDSLGLLLGQRAGPQHLGIAGFLVQSAQTTEQGLRALIEHLNLHDEAGAASLEVGEAYSKFSFSIQLPGLEAGEQIYDLSAVFIFKILQVLCGDRWKPATVHLTRREPADPRAYRRFFGTTIHFNSRSCGVTFSSDWLQQQSPSANELLFRHLELEASMLQDLQRGDMMDELPAVLRRGVLLRQCSTTDIADVFGIHERTLQRRLKLAGTTFRKELDKARRAISEQLLSSTTLPVSDIADTLGYADSSGFIRAFERWCNNSPASWRRRHTLLKQR